MEPTSHSGAPNGGDATLGPWSGAALVTGNMIGSGIFLLPASMAVFGVYGLMGWVCASVGAMLLAALFRSLGRVMPHAPGGPYAYVRAAMGDRLGFVVAWGYWVSIWCTNAAIAVACVGYLSVFFPALASEPALGALTGLGLLWGVTAFNALPLRQVAALQGVTVVLKVVPLLFLILLGWDHIRWEWLMVAGRSGEGAFGSITAATTLALFAFLGVESAAIASHRIRNPERNMGRASVMGTALTVVLYVGCSVVVMGTVSPEGLMDSPAPFAESASTFLGAAGRDAMAVVAVLATFGALNGWILIQGQFPAAVAADGLFPGVFGRTNRFGAPLVGIALSSLLASAVLLLNFSDSLVSTFTFMMTLSTLSTLVPFLFSAVSLFLLCARSGDGVPGGIRVLAGVCALFCGWVIFGCGAEVVACGLALLGVGIVLYLLRARMPRP